MTKPDFEALKQLENRITQLQLLKQYFDTVFQGSFVNARFSIDFIGNTKSIIPFNAINGTQETVQFAHHHEDDKQYFLKAIQDRIDLLQQEFDAA